MTRFRRIALVALGAAALAAVAAGFTVGRGGSANAQGPPGVLARGAFKTVSWGTTGSATIERTASGRIVLKLSRDFKTQRAPELFIHLGSKRMPLQSASGPQTYFLSSNVAPGSTVEVFCEKCNKAWGEAKLHLVPRRSA
ncbi:MAG TPA: hypothetical protein VKB10_11955 [Gaiellaceae bacterium]|nr:hypothetical protein [Gaiellaceae bacterium]